MLKIVNFSKQYGSKIAVSNLNLLVQKERPISETPICR